MLRLCLVLALLAAGASLYFGQMVVKPKVDDLTQNLETKTTELTTAQGEKAKAEKESKEAKAAADKAVKELSDTKGALEAKTAEASEQRTRADDLAGKLETNTKELTSARQELGRWKVLGIQPNQIEDLKRDIRVARAERDSEKVANVALTKTLAQAKKELDALKNPDADVELPKGLNGLVTAVGPSNDFVFLDIGSSKGILKGGKLMVRRGDKLISKVKVVSVAENHCVANILPDWTQGGLNVQVGDAVLY